MYNKVGRFSPPPSYDNSFGIGVLHVTRKDIVHILDNEVAGFQTGIFLASTDKITMQVNDAICNIRGIAYYQPVTPPPIVKITDIGTNYVKGKAPPLANVELFVNNQCVNYWENGVWFGSTPADNNGDWLYPFTPPPGVISATATDTSLYTSEFNSVKLDTFSVIIKNATCGSINGSITGVEILNATSWHWENDLGQIISTDTSVYNLAPGRYRLVLNEVNVSCPVITGYYEILSIPSPALAGNPFTLTQPSCGLNNGAIRFAGNYPIGSTNAWLNSTLNPLQYYSDSIGGLAPGTYYFKLYLFEDSACNNMYGPFTLTNQSGPSLNTNNTQLTNATCGSPNGSISGITTTNVTGTPFIQWLDSLNNPVGSSLNLSNIPAGKYKLKFKDQSNCDTIISSVYTIENLGGITIDTSMLTITSSQCAYASGTITGLNVQGATSYQWINAGGQPVSTSLVPGFIYSGAYVLTATNQYGCIKKTDSIHVPTYPYMSFTSNLQIQGRPGRCDSLNGFVNIMNFPNPQNYTFRWIDSLQPAITISTSLNLSGINSGTYILFAKNAVGCEQQVLRAFLAYRPPPVISGSAVITDEICNNQSGSIQGLSVANGISPYTYSWLDANNNVVSNQPGLSNVPAGSYTLIVKDNIGCYDTSSVLQIKNTVVQLNNPTYDDQYVRINTTATLSVLNPQQTTYLLFDSPSASAPIQQNNTGIFTTPPLLADKTYYIQKQTGNCASSKVAVKVYVYDKTNVFVPSAFTPNNDGRNDVLRVRAYGIISLEYFRIYNKW